MSKQSAGILMYRKIDGDLEVFLVHPGGPFFTKKDAGAWSIPKGESNEGEDLYEAARREFREETGKEVSGECVALAPVKLKSGKMVHAWAMKGNIDSQSLHGNMFEMEWPLRSGKKQSFLEVDRGEWFSLSIAKEKMNTAQVALLEALESVVIG
jgi:predicted NUDIX family NTP pyrophosphohydrolase